LAKSEWSFKGDNTLAAERVRGLVLSRRDWLFADGGRARLRAQWRELFKSFDAVICPVMPTPAYPHDHLPDQEKRTIDIDGRNYPYVDQLAWPGIATLPGLPATDIPIGRSGGRAADRRADRRRLAGGSHAVAARRADRARIRRLRAAADV
jgi:Asp-tRNA(Asn)/Glu-tRNA(Gln) amidotransferase A subunit family amidase